MSETVIPERRTEVPTLKAGLLGGLDAELAGMERIIVEREAIKWAAKVAEQAATIEQLSGLLKEAKAEGSRLVLGYAIKRRIDAAMSKLAQP